MAFCIVLLGPKDRRRLKHPVKHPDHHLLIELRALLQDSRPVKILKTEKVRPALSTLSADLRRVDFRKPLSIQKITESPDNAFLYPELRPLPDVAQRNRPIVQFCFQRSMKLPLRNRQRHRFRRFTQNFYFFNSDLNAMRCFFRLCRYSCYFDCISFFQILQVKF